MISNLPTLITATALLLAAELASAEEPAKTATSEIAKSSAEDWLTGLGKKGLVISEEIEKGGLVGKYIAGAKSTSFQLNEGGWFVTVGFSGKVTSDTSLKDLQKRLKYVALDKLPTPGLNVPGWEIKPQTPSSSISKGIEIVDLKEGMLTLRVKTNCFALYGTDPKAMRLVPADAGAPKSAYFQIRKQFPLDLTLTAPFKMAEPEKKDEKKKP